MVAGAESRTRIGLLFLATLLSAPATAAQVARTAATPRPGVLVLGEARAEAARAYKASADAYVSQDRYADAVPLYLEALSLAPAAFTRDERVEMAVYMSWEGELGPAKRELESVLGEDPGHVSARAHLARVLSWSGRLAESIEQADRVLAVSPGHRDALLVKADALEWQGYFDRAIPLYREVLDDREDFDARLGLSYSLLSGGNRSAARRNAMRLAPGSERQAESLEEITREIDVLASPRVDLRHSYYQDSDSNQYHRYLMTYGFGLGNTDLRLRLMRTDSRGDGVATRSRAGRLDVTSSFGSGYSVGLGVGLSRPGTGDSPVLATGSASFTTRLSNGRMVLTASKDVLADTAELIGNRVRSLDYGARLEKPLSDRMTVGGEYHYKDFSDGNHAHDVQITPEFVAIFRPRVSIGYQLRYQDYRVQSGMGYFDPNGYVAHRASVSLYFERPAFYAYANAFGGRQSFTRNGFSSVDATVGGALSVGVSPAEPVTIEVNAEGGNFRAGSVTGFSYFSLGSRIQVMF